MAAHGYPLSGWTRSPNRAASRRLRRAGSTHTDHCIWINRRRQLLASHSSAIAVISSSRGCCRAGAATWLTSQPTAGPKRSAMCAAAAPQVQRSAPAAAAGPPPHRPGAHAAMPRRQHLIRWRLLIGGHRRTLPAEICRHTESPAVGEPTATEQTNHSASLVGYKETHETRVTIEVIGA